MPLVDETTSSEVTAIDTTPHENFAEALLTHPVFCAAFPGLAYVFAVFIQTQLNDLASMGYGASVLYLSFGVRLFVALVFGYTGLLWMMLGQLFIFAFYPTPYYEQHLVEGFLLTCWYSLIAFFSVELVRKIRHIKPHLIRARTTDVLLITFFSSLFSSLSHFSVLGDYFAAPLYNMLMSFTAKYVGSMIGFYSLMLIFSML
jgi:hypothetical protein